MKDIKSLHLAAKGSGRDKDISAYIEAVHEILESDPMGYLSNLEYIISSSVGASTLSKFIESHGLPIAMYDQVMTCLEQCIERGEASSKNVSAQKKAKAYLESFKAMYPNCFMMFESMANDYGHENFDMKKYVETYYGTNDGGHQNRKLMVGMLDRFREMAIPDLFITAGSLPNRDQAVRTVVEYFNCAPYTMDPSNYQWIRECAADVNITNVSGRVMENSLQQIVDKCRERNTAVIREAVILGDDNRYLEYGFDEFKAIEDLIAFREYQMLYLEGDAQIKCYQDIMSLYEECDGIIPKDYSCFSESNDPRKKTLKEIADRLNTLANQATKYVKAEFVDTKISKYAKPYAIRACYGTRRGPGTGFGGLKRLISKNMDDISDFSEEWMKEIYLFVQFEVREKSNQIKETMSKARSIINKALKPLMDDDKLKAITQFDMTPVNDYLCWFAFKVGKTYAVGDSDIGMFESYQELYEAIADNVVPMLTGTNQMNEARWMYDSLHKKTGAMPSYIAQNHDLGYGEDDGPTSDEPEPEHDLEDFRRPSASPSQQLPDQEPADDVTGDETSNDVKDAEAKAAAQQAINNYYYYTYNNSLNKNSNSFNKSHQDDHSVHTKDDHSTHTSDDHSAYKRINSNDVGTDIPHEESAKNLPRDFTLFGVRFELPAEIGGIHHGKVPKNEDSVKQKAHNKMLSMINSPKKIKRIENAILAEERNIGEDGDTDEIRTDRIKKYLSKASIKKYSYTPKGNAIFKIDIPYIKGVLCAWEEHELWITSDGEAHPYDAVEFYEAGVINIFNEEVGDADDDKPKSDNPIQDTLMDIDKSLTKHQQNAKRTVQKVQNTGRALMKPVRRTQMWLSKVVSQWKDADETKIKEQLADPHSRNALMSALRTAIKYGALAKAGLLLNPIFLGITILNKANRHSKEFRLRNEMIGELKTELEIIDQKISDAKAGNTPADRKAVYQLMRFKNELNKKLLRVGGTKEFKKII